MRADVLAVSLDCVWVEIIGPERLETGFNEALI
jgi:hypothetical protein